MSDITKIKDPLYGYIKIEDSDITSILNSAEFHRLSDIVQTSYSSVFPTSTHNRFTHSLGVYYLGTIASSALVKSFASIKIENFGRDEIEKYKHLFLLACLLHDVGHAPFSHTGEAFYLEDKQNPIWEQLKAEIGDDCFNNDSKGRSFGAPHEIMSALASLKFFPKLFTNSEEKAFFARCIVGLKYGNKSDIEDVKNCFVELLNSKTIDVDKLDYLLRDSFVTGFSSVSIDYKRLLSAVCIAEKNDKSGKNLVLAFNKSALSTLESVVLAHDMERKWIQNHPVIQYENYLVKYIISEVVKYYQHKNISIFSFSALTTKGCSQFIDIKKFSEFVKNKTKNKTVLKWLDSDFTPLINDFFESNCINLNTSVRLLTDSDVLATAKNSLPENDIINEYFSRSSRKKSFWKSESEYKILFEQNAISKEALKQLEDRFTSIENGLKIANMLPIINADALQYFKEQKLKLDFFPGYEKVQQRELNSTIDLLELLENFANEQGIPFEFVTISANQFNTGFNKKDFKEINVYFPNLNNVGFLKDAINLFDAEQPRSNFFYLYAKMENRDYQAISNLVKRLIRFAMDNYQR